MKNSVSIVALCIASLLLGAGIQKYYDTHRSAEMAAALNNAPPKGGPAPGPDTSVNRVEVDLSGEPLFAYGFSEPAKPGDKAVPQGGTNRNLRKNQPEEEQTRLRQVPGSRASYSLVDVRDGANVIDWFPDEHPPMPDVVKHGPVAAKELKRGCASCHLPSGQGRPENAPVGGQPVAYITRQINDFRHGLRYTADPRKPNTNTMIMLAKAMTDDELKQAAEYFSAIKWRPWTRVVETNMVPKTKIEGNLFIATEEAMTEPINGRIIEVPENEELSELVRSPHSGFVAYVPVGSLAKGKDLVTTGGMRIVNNQIVQGKTTACGTCHGVDLLGVADVPPIAGRSASYIMRQLFDMQRGSRNGNSAQLMKLAIQKLTPEDMVAIAAYVASLPPSAGVGAGGATATN